jgi:hypothetical protein
VCGGGGTLQRLGPTCVPLETSASLAPSKSILGVSDSERTRRALYLKVDSTLRASVTFGAHEKGLKLWTHSPAERVNRPTLCGCATTQALHNPSFSGSQAAGPQVEFIPARAWSTLGMLPFSSGRALDRSAIVVRRKTPRAVVVTASTSRSRSAAVTTRKPFARSSSSSASAPSRVREPEPGTRRLKEGACAPRECSRVLVAPPSRG